MTAVCFSAGTRREIPNAWWKLSIRLFLNLSFSADLQVLLYLVLRATLAPALMVAVAYLLGFQGDLATALVILALLPVAQTAFVVAEQHDAGGAAAVGVAMVASLLLMLPQLMAALKLLQWSQLLQP